MSKISKQAEENLVDMVGSSSIRTMPPALDQTTVDDLANRFNIILSLPLVVKTSAL